MMMTTINKRRSFNFLLLIIILTFSKWANANKCCNVHLMERDEINRIFNGGVRESLGIKFDIVKAWHYVDKNGTYYLILTEHIYKNENNSRYNDEIRAYSIKVDNSVLTTNWIIKDYADIKGVDGTEEYSIWFWTNYISVGDYDNDGLIEPILVYGTNSINGFEDGRLKIIVFYKDKKYAIRHQNSTLDIARETTVDKSFYSLPINLQNHVTDIMKRLSRDKKSSFSSNYIDAMHKHELHLNDN